MGRRRGGWRDEKKEGGAGGWEVGGWGRGMGGRRGDGKKEGVVEG